MYVTLSGPRMETLPPEIVEKIAQHLSPRDLARLCAVSRRWRETFDEDRLWKPYCDPALEKPLRTTPSVAEPKFALDENEHCTLTFISHWRLAFIREKHLWKNWKLKISKKESILKLENEIQVDFLSDNCIVRWYLNRIEIWDVSVIPAILVAQTDSPLDLSGCLHCSVVGNSVLIVKQFTNAQVFNVDMINKCIKLKINIFLGERIDIPPNDGNRIEGELHGSRILSKRLETCVKGNILLHVDDSGTSLDVFDLENGKKVKSEPCPQLEDRNVKASICATKSSDTSDDLVVIVGLHTPGCSNSLYYHYYVYSTKDLCFLPGPIVKSRSRYLGGFAIHRHYLAVGGENTSLKIFNYNTSELVFEQFFNSTVYPSVFNDMFIFLDYDYQSGKGWLKTFSPPTKTLTTIIQRVELDRSLRIINDKFVVLFDIDKMNVLSVWEAMGQSLKQSDIFDPFPGKINKVFTRGVDITSRSKLSQPTINIYHYW